MKPVIIALSALLLAAFVTIARAEAGKVETEHLIVEWVDGTSENEIATAKADGERYYAAIHELLGYEPPAKVTIILSGPAEQPGGKRDFPRVDSFGRVHLFKYDPSGRSYFSALAHEMVHVFRLDRAPKADWFFEEGFAEFVALRIDPSLEGFPWYGFPVVIAAGQWFTSGEEIPLSEVRTRHNELNQPCRAQSYTLRSAFFDFLGRQFGDTTVVAMANQAHAGDIADYAKFFKKEFAALEKEWIESIRAQFAATPDHEALAARYRKESPIQYQPVCKQGQQF